MKHHPYSIRATTVRSIATTCTQTHICTLNSRHRHTLHAGCVREIALSLAIPQSKHVPKLLQKFVSDRTYSSDVSVNGCSGFFQPKKPGDIVQGRYDGQHTLAPGQVQKVSALRLDSVVNEDVLLWHLDTEGFEPRVLASAEAILSTKKVQNVIAEFRPSRYANTGTAAGEAQQIYSRFVKLQNNRTLKYEHIINVIFCQGSLSCKIGPYTTSKQQTCLVQRVKMVRCTCLCTFMLVFVCAFTQRVRQRTGVHTLTAFRDEEVAKLAHSAGATGQ